MVACLQGSLSGPIPLPHIHSSFPQPFAFSARGEYHLKVQGDSKIQPPRALHGLLGAHLATLCSCASLSSEDMQGSRKLDFSISLTWRC